MSAIGVKFSDPQVLESALTHRSYVHENYQTPLQSNERLEFLGDSVLNFITAQYLYETFPDRTEGQLTALRAALVREETLAGFARACDFGPYLKLGKGEERSGGRERNGLLADTFEAVVAAIFLDQGMDAAIAFLRPMVEAQAALIATNGLPQDDKSRLQERVQSERNKTPRYRTVHYEGPDHDRMYTVEVYAGDDKLGSGVGNSKQMAQQLAAREALAHLDRLSTSDGATP